MIFVMIESIVTYSPQRPAGPTQHHEHEYIDVCIFRHAWDNTHF